MWKLEATGEEVVGAQCIDFRVHALTKSCGGASGKAETWLQKRHAYGRRDLRKRFKADIGGVKIVRAT